MGERSGQSSVALLRRIPALVILQRMQVPVLALTSDGNIAFANWAFAEMIGHTPEMVLSLKFREIFQTLPDPDSLIIDVQTHADLLVELIHLDGSIVQAKMSKAVVACEDDQVALATFQDLTEQIWRDEL
jgi:PAS domain S-box-containing protein